MFSFLTGYKTYLAAGVGIALGAWQGLADAGVVHSGVPASLPILVGFLGLGALRSSLQGPTEQIVSNIASLFVHPALASVTPEQKVAAVVVTPAYKAATETTKTDLLNASQLPTIPQSKGS